MDDQQSKTDFLNGLSNELDLLSNELKNLINKFKMQVMPAFFVTQK